MLAIDKDNVNFHRDRGLYSAHGFIMDRFYKFIRVDSDAYTVASCLLAPGATLISVFYCADVKLDNNLIVFYHIGDPRDIKVEYRIRSNDPFGIYHLSIPFIDRVTAPLSLPPIFDSPYGRWVVDTNLYQFAINGFNRDVEFVWKLASDGIAQHYQDQQFLVGFHNGDYVLASGHVELSGIYAVNYYYIRPLEYDHDKADTWSSNQTYRKWIEIEKPEHNNLPATNTAKAKNWWNRSIMQWLHSILP